MTICYFGIYEPDFGRNKVYLSGLRQNGVKIIECRDQTNGFGKYINLWKKHSAIKDSYDVMVVGYPGHIVTPLARLISHKPVILDALCSLYEGEVISRGKFKLNPFKKAWIYLIDWLAVHTAHITLVETEAQKEFFVRKFRVRADKIQRVFTGVDEDTYYREEGIPKNETFTAVFRGRFLPEAGVDIVIRAAKLLEDSGVNVRVIGGGHTEKEIWSLVENLKPQNLEWIRERLEPDTLRRKLLECHVALGQFSKHERLERTIPHKAFESLALGLPYITGRARGISELLTDGKDCLMINLDDPEDLAAKILKLKEDETLRNELVQKACDLYESRLTSKILAKEILGIAEKFSR